MFLLEVSCMLRNNLNYHKLLFILISFVPIMSVSMHRSVIGRRPLALANQQSRRINSSLSSTKLADNQFDKNSTNDQDSDATSLITQRPVWIGTRGASTGMFRTTRVNLQPRRLQQTMSRPQALKELGLSTEGSESLTPQQIKSAYRRLAMQYHPDRGGRAEDMFRINQANEVLLKPKIMDQAEAESEERAAELHAKATKEWEKAIGQLTAIENMSDGIDSVLQNMVIANCVDADKAGFIQRRNELRSNFEKFKEKTKFKINLLKSEFNDFQKNEISYATQSQLLDLIASVESLNVFQKELNNEFVSPVEVLDRDVRLSQRKAFDAETLKWKSKLAERPIDETVKPSEKEVKKPFERTRPYQTSQWEIDMAEQHMRMQAQQRQQEEEALKESTWTKLKRSVGL